MVNKKNIISGGRRGDDVAVYCDDYDIHEISHDVANGFGWSADYKWSKVITDLRCNKDEQEYLKEIFPELSEEAYRAILDATIRGVKVIIIYGNEKHKTMMYNKMCAYNHLHSCFTMLPPSKQQKILKMLNMEGYEWLK